MKNRDTQNDNYFIDKVDTLHDVANEIASGDTNYLNCTLVVCVTNDEDDIERCYEIEISNVLSTEYEGKAIAVLMKILYKTGENSDKYFLLTTDEMNKFKVLLRYDNEDTDQIPMQTNDKCIYS